MAILSNSGNSWFSILKLLTMSTAVVCVAVMLKFSVPTITSHFSLIWSVLLSWLRPPYIYILINCIIVSIVASSRIQQKSTADDPIPEIMTSTTVQTKVSRDVRTEYEVLDGVILSGYNYDSTVAKAAATVPVIEREDVYAQVADRAAVVVPTVEYTKLTDRAVVSEKDTEMKVIDEVAMMDGEDEFREVKKPPATPQSMDSIESIFLNGKEERKPPASTRFSHRKASKPIPEGGKALGVSKPKRQDTLESTWRTITEGRAMPLARHLKKSDTWEQQGRHPLTEDQNSSLKVKNSETFNDRTSNALRRSTGSGKLKKEASLGQDELNRRVEAFIKNFNEEMKMQRQESLNQYQEMIRRGAHF